MWLSLFHTQRQSKENRHGTWFNNTVQQEASSLSFNPSLIKYHPMNEIKWNMRYPSAMCSSYLRTLFHVVCYPIEGERQSHRHRDKHSINSYWLNFPIMEDNQKNNQYKTLAGWKMITQWWLLALNMDSALGIATLLPIGINTLYLPTHRDKQI